MLLKNKATEKNRHKECTRYLSQNVGSAQGVNNVPLVQLPCAAPCAHRVPVFMYALCAHKVAHIIKWTCAFKRTYRQTRSDCVVKRGVQTSRGIHVNLDVQADLPIYIPFKYTSLSHKMSHKVSHKAVAQGCAQGDAQG